MLKAEIIGNLGKDAEVKEFSGKKYVSLSVACSEYSKDQYGKRTEQAAWVSVLWYGDGGGLLPYLKRGAKVFVRGSLNCKAYATQKGMSPQISINVYASEIQLCGANGEGASHQAPARQSTSNDGLPF